MTELERVIQLYENAAECPCDTYAQLILAALREKQERDKGCEYCKGGGNAESLIDGETTVFITSEDKVFCADQGGDGYLDWKFCPMCGRKLGEHDE